MYIPIVPKLQPDELLFSWLHHNICGATYRVIARNFITDGERCECKNHISEQQARSRIEASGEFQLVDFRSTCEPITIRHLGCGRSFSWNYHKFLQVPRCKLCFPKQQTQDQFTCKMAEIVGQEYTLVGPYIDHSTKVLIRHENCGGIQEYLPWYFLDGMRCKHCTPRYTDAQLSALVDEISMGRYIWKGHKSRNIDMVLDTKSKTIKYLSTTKIIQELTRPTPSLILPLSDRMFPFVQTTTISAKILTWLKTHYAQGELISLEDIRMDGVVYSQIKRAIQSLTNRGELIRIAFGIVAFPGTVATPEEVMVHKYLVRNGKRIGYLLSDSFAYELGLQATRPERIGIVTNVESEKHGRNRSIMTTR